MFQNGPIRKVITKKVIWRLFNFFTRSSCRSSWLDTLEDFFKKSQVRNSHYLFGLNWAQKSGFASYLGFYWPDMSENVCFHWQMAESYPFWLNMVESGRFRAESCRVWVSVGECGWIQTESIRYLSHGQQFCCLPLPGHQWYFEDRLAFVTYQVRKNCLFQVQPEETAVLSYEEDFLILSRIFDIAVEYFLVGCTFRFSPFSGVILNALQTILVSDDIYLLGILACCIVCYVSQDICSLVYNPAGFYVLSVRTRNRINEILRMVKLWIVTLLPARNW